MTVTMDFKECIMDLKEKYHKVVKLMKDFKSESLNESFSNENQARSILIIMKSSAENFLKNLEVESPEYIKLLAILGVIHTFFGTICIDTEEFSDGEKHLQLCLEVIEEIKREKSIVSVYMNVYNQLGILWFIKEPERAKSYLEKSVQVYNENKESSEPPTSLDHLFETDPYQGNSEILWKKFEHMHTVTLYYLAQVHGSLKNSIKSAVYCHITLKRQLMYNEYEFIDWALNAATLSQYFAENKCFKQARNHLSASSFILNQYQKELDEVMNKDDVYESKIEEFNHRSADVARCWAQYGFLLLSKSKERLLETSHQENELSSKETPLGKSETIDSVDDLDSLYFSLELDSYENQVTDSFVLTLSEAKSVFLNSQQWLEESKKYYKLDSLASDYIDITMSHSELYQVLMFFEDDMENQAKYQKRRIDLLESLLEKINSQYYMSHCRKMWYELGTIYIDLLDIKMDKQRDSKERPSPHSLIKINNIITKGLKHFHSFVDSFESKKSQLDENSCLPYGRALFYKGVLQRKYLTLDKNMKLFNTEASLKAYEQCLEFCEENERLKNEMKVELSVCKEMVELLPVIISKMKSDLPK